MSTRARTPTRDTVPAETYARTFENNADGAKVLEDLVARFSDKCYTRGGLEGDRETCYKLGARSVVELILRKINQAHGVDDPNAEE